MGCSTPVRAVSSRQVGTVSSGLAALFAISVCLHVHLEVSRAKSNLNVHMRAHFSCSQPLPGDVS